jgi:hypothetical protein
MLFAGCFNFYLDFVRLRGVRYFFHSNVAAILIVRQNYYVFRTEESRSSKALVLPTSVGGAPLLTHDFNHHPDMLISCLVNVTSVSQDKTSVIGEYLEKFFTIGFKQVG